MLRLVYRHLALSFCAAHKHFLNAFCIALVGTICARVKLESLPDALAQN